MQLQQLLRKLMPINQLPTNFMTPYRIFFEQMIIIQMVKRIISFTKSKAS
jgi:hypothetical protein